MPLRDDLLTEIAERLNEISALQLTTYAEACDIFEAYTFSIVIEAAQRAGGMIFYENLAGNVVTDLIFRTSPGRIYGTTPVAQSIPYTHAVIAFPNKPELEVHQGIYVSGKSGLPHECDIAVILRSEGQLCRNERVNPRCAKVKLAVECKFYTTGLGIGLARGFLGLTSDVWNEDRYFVSNTSSNSVKTILSYHDRRWGHDIIPANVVIINRLRALFEETFEDFKAKN
jgi:hypothetical protein